jgi:hypothetical protein
VRVIRSRAPDGSTQLQRLGDIRRDRMAAGTLSSAPVTRPHTSDRVRRRVVARNDVLVLGGLSVLLLAWFMWPFVVHDARFPLGPDAPVYLWWARLAAEEGLSVVGHRPAVPALTLVLQGALGRTVVEATAALEIALGVALGLAATALMRSRTSRPGWALAGLLTGTFAVHLAAGYLANLAAAATFIAAAAALATATRRGARLAAGLLAACGLAHPPFFVVSVVILALTAALAWVADRDESLMVGRAIVGAVAVAGAGFLSLLVGPSSPEVDTSRDAFLRRAGLGAELRAAYLDRFLHRWTRYVQWASVPLAVVGLRDSAGFVGRFLRAWALVLVAGVAAGLAAGWFPADRLVTFGFVVPLLAALGLVHLVRRFGRRRAGALAVAGALTVAMLAGAFIAWNRQRPFLSEAEVAAATVANTLVRGMHAGVPLVFLVNEPDDTVSFLATRAGNVIRAALPPDRVRDVLIVVPSGDGRDSTERDTLEELTRRDVRAAELRSGRESELFVLTPFDALDRPHDATVIGPDRVPLLSGEADEPLEPMSPGATLLSAVVTLAFLSIAGYGWARVALADPVAAAGVAPAFGSAALILVAIALERAGLAIDVFAGAWLVSAVAGASGYLVWGVFERRGGAAPTPQVDQEPRE